MRKILLSTVALLMTVSMMAIGNNSGLTKVNAINFDWAKGNIHEATQPLWYCVDLAPLEKAEDPTLALYLTNLANESAVVEVQVTATAYGQTQTQTLNYTIAAKDHKPWSRNVKELLLAGVTRLYLTLDADQKIALAAKVYETEDIVDDACSKAVDFNWAGVNVAAGEKWYRLNLSEVNSDKKLDFVLKNTGSGEANVAFDLYLDCPASAPVANKTWTLAAGAEQKEELGRVFLDVLKEDYVYLKLTTNQGLNLRVEEVVAPVVSDFNCTGATSLQLETKYNLTAGQQYIYEVEWSDLIAPRNYITEFTVVNQNATPANLKTEVAFACPVKSVVEQNLTVGANSMEIKKVVDNVFSMVDSKVGYIRFTADQDVVVSVNLRNNEPCLRSIPFDWNVGAKQEAGTTQWYEFDITSLKENKQHLELGFTNHASGIALVGLEIALDCNGTRLPVTLPVPKGFSTGKHTLDYHLLARSPLNRIYVGVTTNEPIELAASTRSALATDPTPCQNAIEVQHGVEYVHNPGKEWYKISLDLLKSKAENSSFYFANKSGNRANVTIGVVPSCMYATGATFTVPIPAGIELGAVMPNVLGTLIEELKRVESVYEKLDAADVFLEITTDQPLHFGLDVVNETTNPCLRSDLITFDWDKGAKVEANKPAWYDLDLTTIKESGKHVKLTFTNHADSIVWATTVVSVDCPAKVTLPFIVPVPANMSIDQVIDYSLFAAVNIEHIYLGVSTDGPLELAASTIDATVSGAACSAATEVVSGDTIKHAAGTQWYQFPMSLFDEAGKYAKLSFKNLTDKTATLKAGVTVGCNYGIVTYGKVKVPRGDIGVSLNIPEQVLAKLRKLIDPAVSDFYLQLASNQDIAFCVNMQATGAKACASAVDFDWADWEANGLQLNADQDVWYKVDLEYPLEKIKNGEDILLSVTNNNAEKVDVEVIVSPSCPTLVSFDKLMTIPANKTVQRVLTSEDMLQLLERYDKYLYNTDSNELFARYTTYVFYNKLDQLLGQYGKYVPYSKIQVLFDRYGHYLELTSILSMIENREQYLTVESVKKLLEKFKDEYSYQELIALVEQYGKYIPFVDAEELIDKYLPYAGGAATMLQKYEKYITDENVRRVLDYVKQQVPIDEIKELLEKIKERIPVDAGCFVHIKSTQDLVVTPDPTYIDTIITAYACGGAEYTEPNTGKTMFVHQDTITWSDTISTADPLVDSVFTYVIVPIVAPQAMNDSILNAIGALPVVKAGLLPDTVASMAALRHYYDSVAAPENISDVLNITWKNADKVVACTATSHTMLLVVDGECDFGYKIPFTFPVVLDTVTVRDTVVECGSYTWPVTGATYKMSDIYRHTELSKITGCDSVYHELHLTIKPITYGDTVATICPSELPYTWYENTLIDATETAMHTFTNAAGCDSIVTLSLIVLAAPTVEPESLTLCPGELPYTWRDQTVVGAGTYHSYEQYAGHTCDSVDHELTVTLLAAPTVEPESLTLCPGELPYTWRDQTVVGAGTYHSYEQYAGHTCDSVDHELTVIINTPITTPFVELDTICVAETYVWRGQTVDANKLSYYDTVHYVGSGCDSAYYELHLSVYNVTLPTITEDNVIAICGNAIDVTRADSIIQAHIEVDPLYAAVEAVIWEVKENGSWKTLTTDAIDGTITEVTLRYIIQTECEDVTSAEITIIIETPTPENDEEMANIPAYNKYGGRLLTIDLKYIEDNFGWVVAEADVTWYLVVEGDEDKVVGTGYYLTTADGTSLPAGYYYARVNHKRVSPSDCDGVLQTVILLVGEPADGIKLAPSVAKPQELIRLLNLDPEAVSIVRMYSATGELMDTFQITDTKETTFSAAHTAGYYIVEVQTETEKVSLRYVVK